MSVDDSMQNPSAIKRALLAIKTLQEKLDAVERARTEPIAIIGVGCRFPGGADTPDQFWRLLEREEHAYREVPPSRWCVDDYYHPLGDSFPRGKTYSRGASFLDDVEGFDAAFFGISPREALMMDPNQRLLLEVAWEALERAGIAPDQLAGSRTGVFVGTNAQDYAFLATEPMERTDGYTVTGNDRSVTAGRIAYFLGVHGPTLSIDTACSSSLVATHLAMQSLRAGECELAIVGGVSLLLTPHTSIQMAQARALSPDGRCKTFARGADGYAQGEGCGVVILKRLSAAIRDGDSILAVVRGSAMNHDGPSSGLTVPNGHAQRMVLRNALADGQVQPGEVGYIEAHGSGTALGDPIEAEALGEVFAERAPSESLWIGSVKTNIGHLEAAAGIAGLIKAALCVYHRKIPAHLHFAEPSPLIPWDRILLRVPTSALPFPQRAGRRIAGVSSFGISGTNVHVLLEEPPPVTSPESAAESASEQTLTLSARTPAALRALAGRYAAYCTEHPDVGLADLCIAVRRSRTLFAHRLSIVTSTIADLQQKLCGWLEGRTDPAVLVEHVPESSASHEVDVPATPRRRLVLPTYPFQHERFWLAPLTESPEKSLSREPLRTVESAPREDWHDWLYDLRWRPVAASNHRVNSIAPRIRMVTPDELDRTEFLTQLLQEKPSHIVFRIQSSTVSLQRAENDLPDVTLRVCDALLRLVQAIVDTGIRSQLWLLTQGAQHVLDTDEISNWGAAQAALWGLMRTVRAEHPKLGGRCCDIDAPLTSTEIDTLLRTETFESLREVHVAYRQGRRFVLRLERVAPEKHEPGSKRLRADGSYLVTGGLGGLGVQTAHCLLDAGAGVVVLSARKPSTSAELMALLARGRVHVVQADVSQPQDVLRLVAECQKLAPLRGIVHAAGVLDDGALWNQSAARFQRVMAPKVTGAWLLDKHAPHLDFFLHYSSMAAITESAGLGNYASANAFLDGFAWARNRKGCRSMSIQWGPWSGVGMAANTSYESLGIGSIPTIMGRRVIAGVLDRLHREADDLSSTQLAVMPLDWPLFLRGFPIATALFDEFRGSTSRLTKSNTSPGPTESNAFRHKLLTASPADRSDLLMNFLRTTTARVLGFSSADKLDPCAGLLELGMGSLMAVELRNQLCETLALPLPTTLVFDYPSLTELQRYLLQELQPSIPGDVNASTQIRSLETRGAESESSKHELIAIVGMACRFPGNASTPEALWELLRQGGDAITTVPPDRWINGDYYDPDPHVPGKTHIRHGGFVSGIDQFDPTFFGISPREAVYTDPQQRLLLELSWEALERAAIAPAALRDTATGVFVGIAGSDYGHLLNESGTQDGVYSTTGIDNGIASGRISYVLGLTGPSMSIDTACSSALVALHLACQSLRNDECNVALVGGVGVMLRPQVTIGLSKAGMLSADGRCKTFAAGADGYVRGEGGAVVVLKRLADALADKDPICAVICGSAINHDGASGGLTAPRGPAQQQVIRKALAAAHVRPDQITYIEAHGTGTLLGDPIELGALAGVFNERHDHPVWIGSVKTNIGHLETAAGVAGLLKVVLMLQHREIAPHLHFHQPTPHFDWASAPLHVPTGLEPWDARERYAGISSFGYSGTNAHVIVTEAPLQDPETHEHDAQSHHLLTLSATSVPALTEQAERLYEWLQTRPDVDLRRLGSTLAFGRTHLPHRLGLVASSAQELATQLHQLVAEDGALPSGAVRGQAAMGRPPGHVAFLFTGQGAQYPGMARELYESNLTFRQVLDHADELLRPWLGQSLLPLLCTPADAQQAAQSPIHQTAFAQPALFVLEYALAQVWQSWGIRPHVLLGHSIGEYVAACAAGVFSFEDALRLTVERGRLMQSLPQDGAMAALGASESEVLPLITPYQDELSLAAVNGPAQVVISGRRRAVEHVAETLRQRGRKARLLNVSHAFHSPLMAPILDEFAKVAASVRYRAPSLPIVSNLDGQVVTDALMSPEYWVRHLRAAVRFADGLTTLSAQGVTIFVEIGPSPALLSLVQDPAACLVASLRADQRSWQALLFGLGQLYVRGYEVNWTGVFSGERSTPYVLPTYPFQRKRYWLPESPRQRESKSPAIPAVPVMAPVATPAAAAAPSLHRERVVQQVRALMARLLQLDVEQVDIETPFLVLGCDSVILLDAVRTLEERYGLKLSVRQVFDHLNTVNRLSEHIVKQVAPASEPTQAPPPAPQSPPQLLSNLSTNIEPTVLERIFQQQLQMVADATNRVVVEQLAFLRGQQINSLNPPEKLAAAKIDSALKSPAPAEHNGADASVPASSIANEIAEPNLATYSIAPNDAPARQFTPTQAQRQLWLLHQLDAQGSLAYHERLVFRLVGTLDVSALRRAFRALVVRHEGLRLAFSRDGEHVLVFPPECEPIQVGVSVHSVTDVEVPAWLEREGNEPFDLERGPLWRIAVLQTAPRKHWLVVTTHHILLDGLSLGIILTELSQVYAAEVRGESLTLASPLQWSEYASWLATAHAGEAFHSQLRHWQAVLESPLPVLELPADRSHPPVKSYLGGRHIHRLPAELVRNVEELARASGCTPVMVTLAAYLLFLHRLTRQNDIIVGVPTSGRGCARGDTLVAYCTHILPIRGKLVGNPRFDAFLDQTKSILLDAYENADLPYATLLETLRVPRDSSRSPLVSAVFNFNKERVPLELLDLDIDLVPTSKDYIQPDLMLNVSDPEGQWLLQWTYNRDIFDGETIARWAAHFTELLTNICRNPRYAVAELEMVSPEERAILRAWNDTARPYPQDRCVQQLFEEQVARTPEAIAIEFEDSRLTYAELNGRANRLAHHLRALGVGTEVPVGLYVERSLESIVGFWAILKAGGVYVPLDPAYPPERLAFILTDAEPRLVLSQKSLMQDLSTFSGKIICLDSAWSSLEMESDQNPVIHCEPHQLAYMIYTSGSTGKPKGVLVEHFGLANLVQEQARILRPTSESVILQMAAFTFDASLWDVFLAHCHGARLCLASAESRMPGPEFVELLRRRAVTNASLTPSVLAALSPEAFPTLHTIVTTGEACTKNIVTQWSPGRRIYNGYGPTEATIGMTLHDCTYANSRPPIGRPFSNTRVYLLDDSFHQVPIGVAGELFISGVCLARGYHRRASLTAERFLPDPFSDKPGARMYRTGDVARYLPDGNLDFVDRADTQVKLRGLRIELGEIESALSSHLAVRACAVVIRGDLPGQKRLVAYVVPNEGECTSGALREYLSKTLPDYMIPAAFVFLESLPLTPHGKVNRTALPAPELDRAALSTGHVVPRNPMEATLVDIWKVVLGVPEVGINDNFFELGGDSILSIQVITRAARAGLKLTPRQLFERPTIASLAELIVSGVAPMPVETVPIEGDVPLSPIQRWFFAQKFVQAHHWNQAVCVNIAATWTPTVLEAALRAVVERHDALRLAFDENHASLRPLPERVPVQVLDVSFIPVERRDAFVNSVATDFQATMHLSEPPLLRALRVDRGTQGISLVLAIHHLVIDAVGWRILLDDLTSACNAIVHGQKVDFGPQSTSWASWVSAQQALLAKGSLESDRQYWSQVVTAPIAALPVRSSSQTKPERRSLIVKLDRARTGLLLRSANRAYRTRTHELLVGALGLALRTWTHSNTVGILLEGHGRHESLVQGLDVSRTIGWFTTMYPVCLELPDTDVGRIVKATKEQLRAIPHEGATYGMLRWFGEDGDALALPEGSYGVVFNYLGQVRRDAGGLGADAGPIGECMGPANALTYRVAFNGAVIDEVLEMQVDWDQRWFDEGSVEGLAEQFITSLQAIVAHCAGGHVGGLTSSDVPISKLDQATLDGLGERYPALEDVYPATPMQSGMLFHALQDPSSSAYFEQMRLELPSNIDEQAFEQAFSDVVARHAVLRTALVWENVPRPMQVVLGDARVTWSRVQVETNAQLDEWLEADRRRGFALDQAPLIRCAWLRQGNRRYWVWSSHHVLLDGWSMPVVLGEVLQFYRARTSGDDLTLPNPSLYRDYVAWLEAQDRDAALAYWRARLRDIHHGFRIGLPQPKVEELGQGEYSLRFDPEMSANLQSFVRAHGLTLNTLLQGAWAILLATHSGHDDVCFGVTVSGRPAELPGIETMVGLFINTLPLRVRVHRETSVLEWLATLQREQAQAREYQSTPLAEIQRCAGIAPAEALFDTLLVFENYPLDESLENDAGALELGEASLFEQTNYDLTVSVLPGKTIEVRFAWSRQRFDGQTITRLAGRLWQLLASILAHPQSPPCALELRTENERKELAAWNDTAREYAADKCIHELFDEQALRTPDAIAVVFNQEELTYADLNMRANQLAHYLQSLGVGPEVLVGLCVERSIEMVVGLLAILKAGGAYVPIDPTYPTDRIAYMLSDARVRVLLTLASVANKLPAHGAHVVRFDADAALWQEKPFPIFPSDAKPDNAAYIVYTSGSTGQPKGVLGTHRGIVNRLCWAAKRYPFASADIALGRCSIHFVDVIAETWSPLVAGVPLVLLPKALEADPDAICRLIEKRRITHLVAAPALLRALLTVQDAPTKLATLRRLHSSGEALDSALATALKQALPHCVLLNIYGSSEVSADATAVDWHELPEGDICIGQPLANVMVWVLGSNLEQCAVGLPGEIYVGGVGVAQGYLHRPGFTAERFVPNPFGPPGSRMYRTGDLARWRADGNLEFLGRIDHQVKIRGFRIELGEIESAISSHPSVRASVVLAREDIPGDKRLVAYVVPHQGEFNAAELRQHLKAKLPDYMIPAAFVVLESLPLTPNGKIDRKVLPAPDHHVVPLRATSFAPPETATEKTLATIWSDVLKVSRIGLHDDFFALGGHSLIAIQIISRMERLYRRSLPVTLLFKYPTIARLARLLDAQTPISSGDEGLLVLRETGLRRPLFVAPGGGSDAAYFYELSQCLDPEQPVYGLRPVGIDGRTPPAKTVEEAAAHHVEAIRAIQAHGPYLLLGHSSGGYVAFAIAQQLAASGHEVGFLGILDIPTPDEMRRSLPTPQLDEIQNILLFAESFQSYTAHPIVLSRQTLEPLSPPERLVALREALIAARLMLPDTDLVRLRGAVDVARAAVEMGPRYHPQASFRLPIHLFRADEPSRASANMEIPLLIGMGGWDQYGPTTVHAVPGNHYTLLHEPHVSSLARVLETYLCKFGKEKPAS